MLETDRLFIRPPMLSDAQNLIDLNADPDVMRFTGDDFILSNLTDAHKLLRERMAPQFEKYKMSRFMVFLKDGTFLGWCGLKYFPETQEVDLGYRFMKKHWGKGYATESSLICLHYGFETLKLKKIIAKAMPQNINSIKVLQKLGMTFRGYVNDPTDPHSFLLYDITQAEYSACAD